MKELTKEQEAWVAHVNSDEFRKEARKNQEANEAARALAQAEYDRQWAEYRAKQAAFARQQEEAMRPLKQALSDAGIRLSLSGYDGVWGEYQLGDGPVVQIEDDSFHAWED